MSPLTHLYKADLMKRILDVRYTDLEEEKVLCKQLLEVAEPEQDSYCCAFANVYLLDSLLALGDYSTCNFYLSRASLLCQEHGFDDLMLSLCNFAGLYYLKLNDEQTALQYYLQGLALARRIGDHDTMSKIYNNIGLGFSGRDDWASAQEYFQRAISAIEQNISDDNRRYAVSYLSNLSEASQFLGDAERARQALERCAALSEDSPYQRIRLLCGWVVYYSMIGDTVRCGELTDQLLDGALLGFENKFFVCDMCLGMFECMLNIGDEGRARRFLDVLDQFGAQTALGTRYRIQRLRICYWENSGQTELLDQAYRDFYEITQEMAELENKARAQSMLSRIQLSTVQAEREATRRENSQLENVSQVDELTGLYNRRYFKKLVSKIAQSAHPRRLGFIMLDLDYFKQYNDCYGHFMGDGALKTVGELLTKNARPGLYVSRYGGDEFVCLCVDLSDEDIECYLEAVRSQLAERAVVHEKSPQGRLCVSLGYSNEVVVPGLPPERLLDLADQALYQAKKAGRNGWARQRVQVSER